MSSLQRVPRLVGLGLGVSLAAVVAETAVCRLLLDQHLPDIVMVYLLGVVLLAVRFGYAASLPATAFSVLAFDFFFTPPYLSFDVQDKRFLLTFLLMAFVAAVISNQTERIVRREVRTAKLYAMTRELSIAGASGEMARAACRHLAEAFDADVWVVLDRQEGGTETFGAVAGSEPPPESTRVPLGSALGVDGFIALRPTRRQLSRTSNRELLDAFANQLTLALQRAKLADEAQHAHLEVQTERLRNALLRSVSHDFRTPLGVIKGSVTAIIEQGAQLSAARQAEHLKTISEETTRLNRLLRNLLSMTSLESGTLRARKAWHPLEEVIGVALNRLDEQLEDRRLTVAIEPAAALAPFDATLIEQVLVNLVENAAKYTPRGLPIRIGARRVGEAIEVEVEDQGPGVPVDQREVIFDKFHRAVSGGHGMGLGLTICRGILTAHGGRVWCEQGAQGGSIFRFSLPSPEAPVLTSLPEAPA
jgi:two-component system sensor histidine kinase KdpD